MVKEKANAMKKIDEKEVICVNFISSISLIWKDLAAKYNCEVNVDGKNFNIKSSKGIYKVAYPVWG